MTLVPIDAARDAEALYAVSHPPGGDPTIWTYLPYGPYESVEALRQRLTVAEASEDPLFFTVLRSADEEPLGWVSYLRRGGCVRRSPHYYNTEDEVERVAAAVEEIVAGRER